MSPDNLKNNLINVNKNSNESCLEIDIDYNGYDVGKITEEGTLGECQNFCKTIKDAKYFSYGVEEGCFCKKIR
eukprot:UN26298